MPFVPRATAKRHHFLLSVFLISEERQSRKGASRPGLPACSRRRPVRPRDPAPGTAGWTRPSHRQWPRLPCGEGGAEESSSASIAGQEGGRQKRADSRRQQDRRSPERQAPRTALDPRRQVGSPGPPAPHSPGDCSPSLRLKSKQRASHWWACLGARPLGPLLPRPLGTLSTSRPFRGRGQARG